MPSILHKEYIYAMNLLLENEQYRTALRCAEIGITLLEEEYTEIQSTTKNHPILKTTDCNYTPTTIKTIIAKTKKIATDIHTAPALQSKDTEALLKLTEDINTFAKRVTWLRKKQNTTFTLQLFWKTITQKKKK